MYPHHQQTIERLVAQLQEDPRYLAVIIGGSIAKGRARPDSDVDIILVATDAEFERCLAAGAIQYLDREIADYPGGYVEGKIVNRQFLLDVADHGSEPARSAFGGAFIVASRLPDLPDLLARIPIYPEHERAAKMAAFYSQVVICNWFVSEAEKRADAYLLTWAASNLALFAGRLVLAHNRILYPWHKWFMETLRGAPDQPPDFVALVERLLARPDQAQAQAVRDSIEGFPGWELNRQQIVTRFTLDNEWNWRTGRPPLADW
jgi:predicted nucleotidyltransferase